MNSAYDTDVEVATFSTYKKTVTVKCEGASQTVTAYSGVDGKDESGALVQAKTGESLTDNGAASTDVVSSAIYEFIDKDGNTFFDGTESYYYANIGDKNPFGEEKTEADTTKTNYSYTTFVKAITAMCSYVMGDVTEDTDIEDYIDQYFMYAEKIYKNAITSGRYNLNITDKETGTNIAWIDEASGQTVTSNQSSLITYASMKYYLNGEPVGLMTDDETSNEWMHEHLTESELFAETNTESKDYVTWEQWQDYDDADNLIAVNDADNEFTESVVEYWLDEEMWELFTIRNPNYAAVFSGIDSSYLVGDTAIDFTPGQYDEEIIAIMRSWTFSDGRQLDDTAIAAMCGNFWAESGMNPARYVSNGSVITCLGLPSYYNGRANNLLSYAASKNVPYYDLTTQMEYIKSELDARPELVNALTSTNSVEYKTGAFFDLFEGGSALSPDKYAAIKAENGTYHTPDGFDISWDRYYFNEYSGKYSIDFGKRLEAARTYASTIETTN
jgi:YD repeat-containing protein